MAVIEQEILEQIKRLNIEQQERVLAFVRSLTRPRGESGKLFLEHTQNIHIDPGDIEAMKQAIEQGCEGIDDNWDND